MSRGNNSEPLRPLPLPDELSAPFWESVRARRMSVQRCAACRRWNHAPTLNCYFCGSEDLAFEPVSGKGRLHAWTILREPPAPGFRNKLPLTVGIVELDEQERLLLTTNLVEIGAGRLSLGLPLEVVYEVVSDECALPQFRPAA